MYKLIMPRLNSYKYEYHIEFSDGVSQQNGQTSIGNTYGIIHIELDRDYEDPKLFQPIGSIELEDESGERFVPEFGGKPIQVNGNKLKIPFIKLS